MTDGEKQQLDEMGFVVLERFMDRDLLRELRTRVEELFELEGDTAGSEFKQEHSTRRLANLVNKGEVFRRVIALPRLLEYVRHVLGERIKLSSLNVRSANPHSNCAQPLHADMGAVPDDKGFWVCNSVWMLDDFTLQNGAIRLVPGSHRRRQLPQEALEDPSARHPDEILLTGAAGSVVIMNAHVWHGATDNRTGLQRRAMHAFYTRRDKPQQQYQKRLLSPDVQRSLSPLLRDLLALDDTLNDELSSEKIQRSGFLK
ncbi:MAG TPA: phytanoyl-CoA dioxygenase family protein [Acidobacteriota bacterium]|jgi:ectoine hydroxylase-related dioxygenase (phytanoyl-CoA dioxygenase family)